MESWVIQKGSKRLSSIYINDLAYYFKYVGYSDKNADKMGFVKQMSLAKVFVFRDNSWIGMGSKQEWQKHLDECINEVQNDERYEDKMKESIVKSINNLRKNIVKV